jgi:glycosyltransferase involved in cell wall biosynthesis
MKKPLISVITSVYNGAVDIGRTVDSILNQTVSDYEYFIIDDGSSDGTWEVLRRYAHNDRRIRLLRNSKNVGLTRSLNRCLLIAIAPYVARIDSGDIAAKNRLEKQLRFIENHPEVGVLGSNDIVIFRDFSTYRVSHRPLDDSSILRTLMYRNCFSHSTLMIRRDVFRHFGPYRTKLAQDYDLILRARQKYRLSNLQDFLCARVQHARNITVKKWRLQDITAFWSKMRNLKGLDTDPVTKSLAFLYVPLNMIRLSLPSISKDYYNRHFSDSLPSDFRYDVLSGYYWLLEESSKK